MVFFVLNLDINSNSLVDVNLTDFITRLLILLLDAGTPRCCTLLKTELLALFIERVHHHEQFCMLVKLRKNLLV